MPASTSKLGPGLSLATRSTEQQARCSPHRLRARPPGRLLSAPAAAAPLVQPLLPRDLELAAPLCTQHRLLPCRLCTPSRLCLLHGHTGLHTSAALRWLLAVTPGLGPRGRMRKAGASAPGSTMHPSKRGRPDSDVRRCQVLKELVGEQRQDGRPRLGRARAGGARCVPGGGRACTAHGADGGCWGRTPAPFCVLGERGVSRASCGSHFTALQSGGQVAPGPLRGSRCGSEELPRGHLRAEGVPIPAAPMPRPRPGHPAALPRCAPGSSC